MRVKTPTLKLDVRIDAMAQQDGQLVLSGMAGMLPCETTLRPAELRKLLRMALTPRILKLLFKKEPAQ